MNVIFDIAGSIAEHFEPFIFFVTLIVSTFLIFVLPVLLLYYLIVCLAWGLRQVTGTGYNRDMEDESPVLVHENPETVEKINTIVKRHHKEIALTLDEFGGQVEYALNDMSKKLGILALMAGFVWDEEAQTWIPTPEENN